MSFNTSIWSKYLLFFTLQNFSTISKMDNGEFKRLVCSPKNLKLKEGNKVHFEFVNKELQPFEKETLLCSRRIDRAVKIIEHHSNWTLDETKRVSFSIHAQDSQCSMLKKKKVNEVLSAVNNNWLYQMYWTPRSWMRFTTCNSYFTFTIELIIHTA